jgi:chromosome segregation ATPase
VQEVEELREQLKQASNVVSELEAKLKEVHDQLTLTISDRGRRVDQLKREVAAEREKREEVEKGMARKVAELEGELQKERIAREATAAKLLESEDLVKKLVQDAPRPEEIKEASLAMERLQQQLEEEQKKATRLGRLVDDERNQRVEMELKIEQSLKRIRALEEDLKKAELAQQTLLSQMEAERKISSELEISLQAANRMIEEQQRRNSQPARAMVAPPAASDVHMKEHGDTETRKSRLWKELRNIYLEEARSAVNRKLSLSRAAISSRKYFSFLCFDARLR